MIQIEVTMGELSWALTSDDRFGLYAAAGPPRGRSVMKLMRFRVRNARSTKLLDLYFRKRSAILPATLLGKAPRLVFSGLLRNRIIRKSVILKDFAGDS
ncbi:hypothetical protein [Paraburkholderia dinghuensis]|uniref:Uncharacterized protein n=1 Tax=Paraburkholderia dinghuensis TaxID=2305225 RepID=A0A3N6MP81_9BURK|nr:hypothetical protein [Paraburkholderia dinghuensis]RQH05724.1 hypothetical protein D1Y85_13955 [Paraburkholderia dinghuensis]